MQITSVKKIPVRKIRPGRKYRNTRADLHVYFLHKNSRLFIVRLDISFIVILCRTIFFPKKLDCLC